MATTYGNVSDEAVRKATGKGWDEWIVLLDNAGAESMSHKEIASMLTEDRWLGKDAGWWAQSITVGYEYAKGRRVRGETADAGFQVGVQKTLAMGRSALWHFLMSVEGLRLWLGEVDEAIPMDAGVDYHTNDGTRGQIRTLRENERIRLTWQPSDWSAPSTLQIYFEDKGDKTALRFHHEKLKDAEQREEMKQHWRSVLTSIAKSI